MIKVFHNRSFLKYFMAPESLEPCEADLAAEVQTESLADAYTLTNNIDDSWGKNAGVKASDLSLRSTSVGDIMQRGSKYYVVEAVGFRELSEEEIVGITFNT